MNRYIKLLIITFTLTFGIAFLGVGVSEANEQTPFQAIAPSGYSGPGSGAYTMGYRFTPTTNGQITKLWCYSDGTKTVKLFSDAGSLLASTSVNCNGTWASGNISPVNITSGQYYRVAYYTGGSGYYYRTLSGSTTGNITIDAGYYGSGDVFPNINGSGYFYGMADISFLPDGGGGGGGWTWLANGNSSFNGTVSNSTIGTIPSGATNWAFGAWADESSYTNLSGNQGNYTMSFNGTSSCTNSNAPGSASVETDCVVFANTTSSQSYSPSGISECDIFYNGSTRVVTFSDISTSESCHFAVFYYGSAPTNTPTPTPTRTPTPTLTPTPVPPTITALGATSITSTTATLGANVESAGGGSITQRGICWGTSANPSGNCSSSSGTTGSFTQPRTGFSAGTLIYYRGYATTSQGTYYSPDARFYTPSSDQSVAIGHPSSVQDSSLGAGTVTYSNPSNGATSNNSYATATLSTSQRTRYLLGTNFGFSIPSNSTIDGIVVEGEYKTSTSVNIGMSGQLTKNGSSLTGGSKGTAYQIHLPERIENLPYTMSKSDLWSTTWTPAEVNASTFGVALDTVVQSTGTSVSFDSMRILIYYTPLTTPTVTTNAASSVTQTTATINATANPNGEDSTGWFRYYTSSPGTCTDSGGTRVPSSSGTSLGSGSTGVDYNRNLTGLTAGIPYYVCAFASNVNGTGVGNVVSFTTIAGTPTSVTNSGETNLGSFYVTLRGSANPNNFESYGFFRVYTSNPGSCIDSGGTRFPGNSDFDVDLESGSSSQNFTYELIEEPIQGTNIGPDNTYYYCAFARNEHGTVGSSVDSFTTLDGAISACDPPASGNHTIISSCSYSGTVGGVDGGTGTRNTGIMTISSGKILTTNPNQQIAWGGISVAGAIHIAQGSALRAAPVWLVDADGDGVIGSTTQHIGPQPAGGIRRNSVESSYPYLSRILDATDTAGAPYVLDCNDNSQYAYRKIANLVVDADRDGYKTSASAGDKCVGASATINGRTYYNDGSGPN